MRYELSKTVQYIYRGGQIKQNTKFYLSFDGEPLSAMDQHDLAVFRDMINYFLNPKKQK